MRLLSVGQFSDLVCAQPRAIQRWVADGVIHPVVTSSGKGGRHLFSIVDVLAVALVSDLRMHGFSLPVCAAALQALFGGTFEELQRRWDDGETHLLVSAGNESPLLGPPPPIEHPAVQARLAGKLWAHVDVKARYEQLFSQLDSPDSCEAKRPRLEVLLA